MFRGAGFLMFADTKHLLGRREIWIWAFVLPIVFFYFIGSITSGWGGASGEVKDTLAVYVAPGAGPLADHFLARLNTLDYAVIRVPDPAALAHYQRRLTIPADFSASILAHRPASIEFSRNDSGPAADYDAVRMGRATYTVLGDLLALASSGQPPTAQALDNLDHAPRLLHLTTRPAGHRVEVPSGFEQAVPGSLVFFILLVLLTMGSAGLVAEREQGILRRLASSPMSRGAVVLGKWGSRMLLGLIQIAFAMLAGSTLFHVHWGRYLPVVVIVLVAYAAFAAATGMLLGSLARTPGQAGAFGSIAANVLACIGGCWWPAEIMPRIMQQISRLTPPGMAMSALHQLINFGSGPLAAAPQIVALIALAAIAGYFAARNFRFQ